MIAYSTVGVNDMARSIAFYDAVFAPLGAARETTSETWTGYRRAGDRGSAHPALDSRYGHGMPIESAKRRSSASMRARSPASR